MAKAEENKAAPANKAVGGKKEEKARGLVTVALKHPTGIILEAFRKEVGHEPVLGGGMRETTVWRSTGKQYPLHGNRVPFGTVPNYPIVAGYALTHNVPADVYEAWCEQHKDSSLIENNLISAFASGNDAASFAEDHKDQRSGMEAVLKGGDIRVDKRRTRDGKFVDAIQTADEQAA